MEFESLEIKVISANYLEDVNLFTNVDVYAVVAISSDPQAMQKTAVNIDCGTNRNTNSTMKFTIDESAARQNYLTVVFQLRCEDSRHIGEARVPVKELLDTVGNNKPPVEFARYQVKERSGNPKAELNFTYTFTGKSSNAAAAMPKAVYPSPVAWPSSAYPPPPLASWLFPPPPGYYPPRPATWPFPSPPEQYPPRPASSPYHSPLPEQYPPRPATWPCPPPPEQYPPQPASWPYHHPPPEQYPPRPATWPYPPPPGQYPPPVAAYCYQYQSSSPPPPPPAATPAAYGAHPQQPPGYPPPAAAPAPYGAHPQQPPGYGYPPPEGYGQQPSQPGHGSHPVEPPSKLSGLKLGAGLWGRAIHELLLIGNLVTDGIGFAGGF